MKRKRLYRISHNGKLVPARFTSKAAAKAMVKLLKDEGQLGFKVVPDPHN